MPKEIYKQLLVMSTKLGFKVTVDWDTNTATVSPGHHSLGRQLGDLTVDLTNSPERVAESFGMFYGMSPERVSELSDPSELTLKRRPRVAARRRAGRSQQEEKSNGKQEARKE